METTLDIHEKSQVPEARRVAARVAAALGMSPADIGRAELVVTEAATNLVKYGKHGAVTVGRFSESGVSGVQITAVDHGPGFTDFGASARDGHSTGGSLGLGLGVIMRASDLFDVYSQPAQGSALLSRIAAPAGPVSAPRGSLRTGVRQTPKHGQTECGDAWGSSRAGRWQRLCMVDGLGHGPLAARASAEAVAVVGEAGEDDSPLEILERVHEALKATRGAVIGLAAIDAAACRFLFAGVGNITGVLYAGDEAHHLMSVEGVVGYNARGLKMQEHPWSANCTVTLSSDGLSTRRSLARYPGLLQRHPALVAAVMHRDFARDTDDATVLVARQMP